MTLTLNCKGNLSGIASSLVNDLTNIKTCSIPSTRLSVRIFRSAGADLFEYCRVHYISPEIPAAVETEAANVIRKSRMIIARQNWQAGKHHEAQMVMQQYCKDNPKDADGWQTRGRIEYLLNQLDKAEDCYRKAIALKDTLSEAHKGLSDVLRMKRTNQ